MAKLSTDIGKTIKQNTVKGVTSALFGSGALGKAIAGKFEEKEEKDTRVAQALTRQNQLFKDNNVTLTRIERLAVNIAQNIGNIAEVMGAQLKKTEENQRLQQENISRKQAASEENQTEAQKIQAPSPTGTVPKEGEDKKKDKLVESISGTKKLMGALLKKFALVGGGLLLAGGAAFAASSFLSSGDDSATEQAGMDSEDQPTPVPSQETSSADVSEQDPEKQLQRLAGEKGSAELAPFLQAGKTGDTDAFIAAAQRHAAANPPPPPPQPTPAAPPPSVAATAQASTEDTIKELEERIAANERRLASRKQGQERQMQFFTKKYGETDPNKLKELQSDSDRSMAEYEKMVMDGNAGIRKTIEDLKSKKGSSASMAGGSTLAMPSNGPSETAATPQQSAPSSGAEVITASTSVAAASEQRASNEQVISTTNNSSAVGSSEITQIPSPIANRGSLDVGVTFDAGM